MKREPKGWIMLAQDGTIWPDPHSGDRGNAMWVARYHLATMTQQQAFMLAEMAEAYCHLAAHPAGTEAVVEQLRALRRAVKARQPRSAPAAERRRAKGGKA